jgi:hypothetical protein
METLKNPYHFEHHLDSSDNIIYVDQNWCTFTLNNNAPNLRNEKVLNTSVYNYISDDETKHIYNVLFSDISKKKGRKVFAFQM